MEGTIWPTRDNLADEREVVGLFSVAVSGKRVWTTGVQWNRDKEDGKDVGRRRSRDTGREEARVPVAGPGSTVEETTPEDDNGEVPSGVEGLSTPDPLRPLGVVWAGVGTPPTGVGRLRTGSLPSSTYSLIYLPV